MVRILILAAAIVVGGFLIGGRYVAAPGSELNVYVVDRFTGSVWLCNSVTGCRSINTPS
jgi:hypothetical protein